MALTPERIAELERLKEMMRQPALDAQRKAQAIFNAEKAAGQPVKLPTDKAKGGAINYPMAPRGEWYGEGTYDKEGGVLKHVTPEEYLAKVRPLTLDDESRENIDLLKKHIQSGKTLDPLLIRASGVEDGRHRAHAAKELGIKRVPVIDFGKHFKAKGGTMSQDAMQLALAKFLEPSKVKERMYHATHGDFNTFRNNHRGIHFVTPSPEFADDFLTNSGQDRHEEGANIMPVHVHAKNPFDYQNKKHVNALATKASLGKLGVDQIKKGDWNRIEDRTTLKAIRDLGHDAVYVNEGGVKNLGVFQPHQIKSAIGNRGTYDPTNPDITKAQGGAVNPFDYENPEHVSAVAGHAVKHKDFKAYEPKLMAEVLSTGNHRHLEDPRIQYAMRQAGHNAYHVQEKTGKKLHKMEQPVVKKAMGGTIQPSVNQMRIALDQNKLAIPASDLKGVGVNEAPQMDVKSFVNPGGQQDGELPMGGVDSNATKPGMQLMEEQPNLDPTKNQEQPQQGGQPQGAPQANPQQQPPSNILQMTRQGQAMNAMTPPTMPKMADGGGVNGNGSINVSIPLSVGDSGGGGASLGGQFGQAASDAQTGISSLGGIMGGSSVGASSPLQQAAQSQPQGISNPPAQADNGPSTTSPEAGQDFGNNGDSTLSPDFVKNLQDMVGQPTFAKGGEVGADDYHSLLKRHTSGERLSKAENERLGLYHRVGGGKKLNKPIQEYSFTTAPNPNVNMAPEKLITPEDLQGGLGMPLIGDSAMAGRLLTGAEGHQFAQPVELEGGHDYMRANALHKDKSKRAIWASGTGEVSGILKKARYAAEEGKPMYGIHASMSPTGVDFSHMPAEVLAELVKNAKITKKAQKAFDQEMRAKHPNFPGVMHPDLHDMLRAPGSGELRKHFVERMGTDIHQDEGFPEIAMARLAVQHPNLMKHDSKGKVFVGSSIGKFNPEFNRVSDPVHPHHSYPDVIGGEYVGAFHPESSAPLLTTRDLFPEFHQMRREFNAPVQGDRRSFERSKPVQKFDQEWLDKVMPVYLKRRKAILGYNKGGKVKDEKLTDNLDTMRFALTRNKKKAK